MQSGEFCAAKLWQITRDLKEDPLLIHLRITSATKQEGGKPAVRPDRNPTHLVGLFNNRWVLFFDVLGFSPCKLY